MRLWQANLGDRFDQVVGVADPRHGEEICAWIKLKGGQSATPEEIRLSHGGRAIFLRVLALRS